MSSYVANSVGSATLSLPSNIVKNDTLRFNITNSSASTCYTGTILSYTFPFDCSVKIHAYGARGSYGNLGSSGLTSSTRSGSGAYVYGTFDFTKGDQVMILVGQHGKDAMTSSSSTTDQTTGAGGGGTFIAKRMTDGTGDTFVGNSVNGSSTTFSGWKVSPLIIAAGGNGSRDNGYSGTGTIYGGLYTTGSQPTYASSRTGGGYSTAYGTTSSNSSSYGYGLSFLYGGLGSQYYYTRSTYAMAGFGCGGSNSDDGAGGGGGGYYGGIQTASACSYNAGSNTGGTSDYNAGDGYVIFEFLSIKNVSLPVKVGGSWKDTDSVYVKINNAWKTADSVYVKIGGNWKQQ